MMEGTLGGNGEAGFAGGAGAALRDAEEGVIGRAGAGAGGGDGQT